jgi:uncharacterized surface protein with fasciclin (FAS1) repeats
MRTKRPAIVGVFAALAIITAACSSASSSSSNAAAPSEAMAGESMAPDTSTMTIPEIAASNQDLSTLVAAIGAADLAETLSGEGPYTVFAPTNDAFDALPEGTLDDLLKPANKDQLAAILTYHVVAGDMMAADVQAGDVTTANGADFSVTTNGGSVTITDGQGSEAQVVTTDIVASNGVIHVIDAVLLPPSS